MSTARLASVIILGLGAGLIYTLFGSATGAILPWQGPKDVSDAKLVNGVALILALFLGAAAVGLVTPWRGAVRLARVAAKVVALLGVYLIFWGVFIDTSSWRVLSLLFTGGLALVLLLGSGGVLYALKRESSIAPASSSADT